MKKCSIVLIMFMITGCTGTPIPGPKVQVQNKKKECIIPKSVKSGVNYYCNDGKNLVIIEDNEDSTISFDD